MNDSIEPIQEKPASTKDENNKKTTSKIRLID